MQRDKLINIIKEATEEYLHNPLAMLDMNRENFIADKILLAGFTLTEATAKVNVEAEVIPKGTDIEFILCAAIWYDDKKKREHQPKNIETGIVTCGLRHGNAFIILYEIAEPGYNKQKVTQGFLTNKGRFVDRKEAYQIAKKAAQIITPIKNDKENILTSEDLY